MKRTPATTRGISDVAAAPTALGRSFDQLAPADDLLQRVVIENVRPSVDGGRFPIKRTVHETVDVDAVVFADGHDMLRVVLLDRDGEGAEHGEPWRESEMTLALPGLDRWQGRFEVTSPGWHHYTIAAWIDRFATWRRDLQVKAAAGQHVGVELLEGALMVREAAARADLSGAREESAVLLARADGLSDATRMEDRVAAALDDRLASIMSRYPDRSRATESPALRVWVDRQRAAYGAWYEMFPRSAGPDPRRSGTFKDAAALLPRIADLGFDVLYLPPIHPIGTSFRKGANNSLLAREGDPGSPWAIGSEAGGHAAVEPGLGTMDDFVAFREEAERLGLEIALDLAWQCSPDHPWVRQHPEWFRHRPDGTIKYAENPPKKYQDIYPLDFESDDWRALWLALLDVTSLWIERGVRIFRVDNPHTKAFGFWEWLIDRIHQRWPDVIFLSEAFTRPALMHRLAKSGFTQSYTYFTWKNTKAELTDYFTELASSGVREYLRPNLFANTPDILHAYLQQGGRPAFEARLILAATLGASYGIYSGFELCEGRAAGPATEEYADSEKYQFRKRDWERPGNINELVSRVNRIRRAHRALQSDDGLRFHITDNDSIIAFSKTTRDRSDAVVVVVNLDPHEMRHGFVDVAVDADTFVVRDLLDGAAYTWRRGHNYVRLDPAIRQAHIFTIDTP